MQRKETYLSKGLPRKMAAVFLALSLAVGAGTIAEPAYGLDNTALSPTEQPEITPVEKPERPENSAKSGVVIDGETGEIIYSKNPQIKRDPLSTTKLLTCMVALEHLELDQTVTVTKTAANTPGSTANLKKGEKVKVEDLIYGALLPSGNDAAVALAISVSGSKSEFAKLMNAKAEELGCVNSNFSNPHGWKAKDHYSTAYDMALITKAAMEVEIINKACGTEMYKMEKTNKHKGRWIATTNYFVAKKKYPKAGVFAGKTGTWETKNASLVSACERDDKVVYAVVMQDTTGGRYTTTNKILNYSYKKLEWMAQSESK